MPFRSDPALKPSRLRVSVTDAHGRPLGSSALPAWLERAVPRRARGDVSLALVSDAVMRRLNRQFRGVDHATDVLTFPAAPDRGAGRPARGAPPPRGFPGPRHPIPRLGDIAIAMGVARRQAHRMGHSLDVEVRILALHGLLHLLGYDHETDRGEMHRTEERLRRRAGLPTGLITRVTGRAGRS
jgi:probable rRNA maturation factor